MKSDGHTTINAKAEEPLDFSVALDKILEYLPQEYSDKTEKQYIDALILATRTSYENGLYQFAYIQYHMLFMTAVYYALLQISFVHKKELEKGLYYLLKDRYSEFWKESNTKKGELYFGSFAIINESDVFMLLRVVGLENDFLGELKDLVKQRNNYAHANGQLLLTSDDLFLDAISNYNEKAEKVINFLKTDLIAFYKKSIGEKDFYDPEIRACSDADEQMEQEFIKKYSLSQTELNWLRKIQLSEFDDMNGAEEIKTLHCALIHYYIELTRDDYIPIADTYIQNKYHENAVGFIENEMGISAYECGKYGAEFPLYECPECGEEQLVFDQENGKYHCFACDEDFTTEDLARCDRCGCLMKRDDDWQLCGNCTEEIKRD